MAAVDDDDADDASDEDKRSSATSTALHAARRDAARRWAPISKERAEKNGGREEEFPSKEKEQVICKSEE